MRLPYHPLTKQWIESSYENNELSEDEKLEMIEKFQFLFFFVIAGLFAFSTLSFFFFMTLYIFG
ncbi:hypothetical protein CSQ32_001276 [Salmonella enterica subsp. diarizonae]|nr:hypothetical protein [Salmonella enterica]ECE5792329.1 hypothetical protein [Salmonella enterica subsp. diarizonae]EAT6913767.1 hypothetical protein [Salmonella enterica]EBC8286927.1 hypothetical protein [Salmonella enterica]EBJ5712366.1 hypothetical protein [Salmonella enterica]